MISVQCPSCKKVHSSLESVLGKKVRCNDCQHVFVVTHDAGLVDVTPTTNLPPHSRQKTVAVHSSQKMIRYRCPRCKTKLESGSHLSGMSDVCPVCKITVAVPVLTKPKWLLPVGIIAGVLVIGAAAFVILSHGWDVFKLPVSAPPKQMVQDTLRASLPPFLSLDSIELEPIPTGPDSVKVKFKAIVTPKEDLYQVDREVEGTPKVTTTANQPPSRLPLASRLVDREVEGTPKVTLLKMVQAAGTKVSLYGFVEAQSIMDKWTLESPQIQVGLGQFGAPRGAFPSQSYIVGSSEANAALKEQAANAELQERIRKADLDRQERERKALQEQLERERIEREKQREEEIERQKEEDKQRQKEEEAARQKLILATVKGTHYIGTLTYEDQRQRLRLVFTEQKDFLIRAEASNPDIPAEKQTFTGELVFNPKPERGKPDVAYPIVLSPIGEQDFPYNTFRGQVWAFYRNKGSLKLRLTDTGLEGEADMSYDYTIRLVRTDRPTSGLKVEPPRRP